MWQFAEIEDKNRIIINKRHKQSELNLESAVRPLYVYYYSELSTSNHTIKTWRDINLASLNMQ